MPPSSFDKVYANQKQDWKELFSVHDDGLTFEEQVENIKYKREKREQWDNDPVNHPTHYTNHPSGIECIQITEHMSFTLGNAIKYIWRADLKNGVEDLKKAAWYIQREIEKRGKP